MIIFGLIRFLYKKVTKPNFFLKKPKSVQTDRFWFGSVFSGFFYLARFFSVWVRFGFFGFRLIKPKSNRTGRFFQNFNWFHQFFFTVRFFQLFFSGFLGFLVFLLTPMCNNYSSTMKEELVS